MDFSYLLELAKSNDQANKQEASVSRFSTKLSRPKKEARPGPKLEAVKAVLDKMVVDKQKENEEARKKKENLLKLRAQDRKSNKRVKAMINMSKGASKSVLDDAKDITTAHGEEQCDEDDYGYESNMSQQIFNKLANRYANMPEDEKLKFVRNSKKGSIDDIKSRVINTLKKEEEEETGPRRRKRKRQSSNPEEDDFINDGDEYAGTHLADPRPSKESSRKIVNVNLTNYKSDKYSNFKYGHDQGVKDDPEKERKKKSREKTKTKAAPPPMSFEELLRVAQKKHQETPLLPPKEEMRLDKEKDKKKEPDRPLTAKEKEELEEERRRKLRRMGKLPPEKKPSEVEVETDRQKKGEKGSHKGGEGSSNSSTGGGSKLKKALEAPQQPEPKTVDRSKYFAVPFSQKPRDTPAATPTKEVRRPQNAKSQSSSRPEPPFRETKPQRPAGPPAKDIRPNKPPKPLPPKGRAGPPPGMHRRPTRPPSPPSKMRIESDAEEDDYDSEMDDFIDDGEDEVDVSSEIKRMFGYDRNKYQDDDDDVDDMEASFSQMQKEERISAKIGLKEDLEDMRREEEEKKLKLMRLKQAKKARR